MTSAFVSIPLSYLAYRLEDSVDAAGTLVQAALQVAGAILFVAITLLLKRFLNSIMRFNDTDRNINLMIIANVVAGVFVLVGLYVPRIKEVAGIAALIIMVFQGIVQIQFGYKLLKLQSSLGGLLRPYCYLNMATGICVASIMLIIPGVVVSAISDLMLATIFFNAAKQLKTTA
jgi:hypothetical protein